MRTQMIKRKNGSIYFLTLVGAIVLVCLVMGLSYSTLRFRRSSRSYTKIDQARIHAELGIRHALHFTTVSKNWRQILSNGKWLDNVAVDQATYTVTGIDTIDGDLKNNPDDPVLLTATATVDGLSRTVQVEASEQRIPSELLKYALAAGGVLSISDRTVVNGDIASNNSIDVNGNKAWVYGNAEAGTTIPDVTRITGTATPYCEPKTFPDTAAIFQYYTSVATNIPYQATIENALLSPTSNPFGATNADGVYHIDGAGAHISIQNCRIVGTLILENCGVNSRIQYGINWQPARPDYPALICNQGINFAQDRDLDEDVVNIDFNLPHEEGYGDIDEIYPNLIQGTILVDGRVYIYNNAHLVGTVISTSEYFTVDDNAIVDWDPTVLDNPTKCFTEGGQLVPIPGTWRQIIP